ncbi:MAG: nuclear transport factor 2 family protein, partial [Verrucomicrobia bacterium]|nr:nuclear transport factor 2 family protein [Verrucomicrobiota bacterium]
MNLPLRSRCLATLLAVAALFRWAVPLHAEDEAKLHDELRQLRTVYENAINSGDLTPLAGLFSPGSSGVVVNNQTFTSLAELKAIYEKFRGSFPGVVYRIKMDAAPSQIYGDIAVAHGTCEESVKLPVGDFSYTSNWTAVLRRVGGQWTLIRSQVTMDPFGSSIVDYLIRQTKLWFGLGGAVGGLVIG